MGDTRTNENGQRDIPAQQELLPVIQKYPLRVLQNVRRKHTAAIQGLQREHDDRMECDDEYPHNS